MINAQPWQTIINTNPLAKPLQPKNKLKAVREPSKADTDNTDNRVLVNAQSKRYSFDDNGGGYLGL